MTCVLGEVEALGIYFLPAFGGSVSKATLSRKKRRPAAFLDSLSLLLLWAVASPTLEAGRFCCCGAGGGRPSVAQQPRPRQGMLRCRVVGVLLVKRLAFRSPAKFLLLAAPLPLPWAREAAEMAGPHAAVP